MWGVLSASRRYGSPRQRWYPYEFQPLDDGTAKQVWVAFQFTWKGPRHESRDFGERLYLRILILSDFQQNWMKVMIIHHSFTNWYAQSCFALLSKVSFSFKMKWKIFDLGFDLSKSYQSMVSSVGTILKCLSALKSCHTPIGYQTDTKYFPTLV